MEPTVKPILVNDSTVSPEVVTGATADEIDAALAYEEIFVPALFRHWVDPLIAAAGVTAGERVLDIACGTGVVTRALPAVLGATSAPVGLDLAPGMLEVARRLNPEIEWVPGDALELPFEDASFDRVLCQFGLMFFAERERALGEMRRVVKPGGRIAIAVWDGLERNPGFAEKVEILDEVGGRRAGDALRAPFCLGDRDTLGALVARAGCADFALDTQAGEARFRSLGEFVEAEVRGWLPIMGVHLSEAQIATIHAECERRLGHLAGGGKSGFGLSMSAHLLTITR